MKLDKFLFEMTDYSDGTVDINVTREDDEPFTEDEARLAANRLYFNVAEECRESQMVCLMEFYEDGSTSIGFRGDADEKPKVQSLRDYIWMRRRFDEAIHGKFNRYPVLPRWMIDMNSVFLFCLTRIMQVVDAVFDLNRGEIYEKPAVRHDDSERLEKLCGEPVSDKVIPLFGRTPRE